MNMRLPSQPERRRYLDTIWQLHQEGGLVKAHDITNVIDRQLSLSLPSAVHMPLFYALINQDYGPIVIERNESKFVRERDVIAVRPETPKDFILQGEAAWLAQAVYRLNNQDHTNGELAELFFDSPEITDENLLVLQQGRTYARMALDRKAQEARVGETDRHVVPTQEIGTPSSGGDALDSEQSDDDNDASTTNE